MLDLDHTSDQGVGAICLQKPSDLASNPELKLKIAGGVLPFGAPPVFPIVANSLNGEKSALGEMS